MSGRQLIADYIEDRTTKAQFARASQCSQAHLTLYLQGKRNLSVMLAKRMSAATEGVVPVRELVDPEIAELIGEAAQ